MNPDDELQTLIDAPDGSMSMVEAMGHLHTILYDGAVNLAQTLETTFSEAFRIMAAEVECTLAEHRDNATKDAIDVEGLVLPARRKVITQIGRHG